MGEHGVTSAAWVRRLEKITYEQADYSDWPGLRTAVRVPCRPAGLAARCRRRIRCWVWMRSLSRWWRRPASRDRFDRAVR